MHPRARGRKLRRWRHGSLCACLSVLAWLALLPCTTSAAIFVRIEGIPGDATAEGYDDGEWFSVDSGSYGTERLLQDPGVKGGTADINIGIGDFLPIGLSGQLGISAAKLAQAAVNGNALAEAEIHLTDSQGSGAAPFVFGKIRLNRVFVVDCRLAGDADDRPRFEFRLFYNEIEIENIERDPDDPHRTTSYTTTWNLVTNTGSYSVSDGSVPNEEPAISVVPDQTVVEDGTLTLQVNITDPDGPAADLTLTGTSDNAAILPNSGIAVSGEGATRSVKITPRADRNGTVRVSLVVSDGSDSVGSSFDLNITPVPDPPVIAELDAQVTTTGDAAFTVPIDASDPDQSAETLLVTAVSADPSILPNSALTLAYAGGWGLKIDPAVSQPGTTSVTVAAQDDTARGVTRSFLLTINGPGNSAPTSITISHDSVDENSTGPVAVGTLNAIDPDGDSSFTFGLIDSAGGRFQLVGDALSTGAGVTFDYEEASQHTVKLSATDGGGLTLVQNLAIQVGNLNEAPTILLDFPAPPDFVGTEFTVLGSQLVLADPDAGASPVRVSLSLLNGTFSIDDGGALAGKVTGNASGSLVIDAVLEDVNQTIKGGGLAYQVDPAHGSDTLTVTIDDLGNSGAGEPQSVTASASFIVQPEPLRQFLDEFFSPAEQADPQFGGLLGDADGDELNTLLEFKLGTSPRDAEDGRQSIELSEVEVDGETYSTITYTQRTDASTPHTTMIIRVASAVSGWGPASGVMTETSRQPLGGDRERLSFRSIAPRKDKVREFYQLFVEYTGSLD